MKHKLEHPRFAPWDAQGMSSHLRGRENTGWRFRCVNWLGLWTYDKCTPTDARWAVAYAPSRTNTRLMPTEAELDLEDICLDAGWEKIAATGKFHIYRNPDPNATELETDEQVRLDTLEQSYHRDLRRSMGLAGILLLVILWAFWIMGRDSLPRLLSASMLPLLILYPIFLIMEVAAPYLLFRRWITEAHRAAELVLPCPPVRHWRLLSRINGILSAAVLFSILWGGIWVPIVFYFTVFSLAALVRALYARRKGDPEEIERKYQNFHLVFLVIFFLLVLFSRHLVTDLLPGREISGVPVSITDITGSDNAPDTLVMTDEHNLLADYCRYVQYDGDLRFSCTCFDQRIPIFREACAAEFRDNFFAVADNAIQLDPGDWGAEHVYRSGHLWLILYPERMISFTTSWELTDDQVTELTDLLKP